MVSKRVDMKWSSFFKFIYLFIIPIIFIPLGIIGIITGFIQEPGFASMGPAVISVGIIDIIIGVVFLIITIMRIKGEL